jgi:mannosyltransferase OCH1-like enzyme
MIPKIIHYCWLSGDPIPPDYARCMETWKQKLTGYEFMLWDTNRFDIESVLWVKQAFDTGLYACAADYIRLYAVYNYGGIYLDMDMEVVKPFDELLNTDIMLAYEYYGDEKIEAGCFGAKKGHEYIKKCMESFEKTLLVKPSRLPEIMKLAVSERYEAVNPIIAPELMKSVLKKCFSNENYHVYSRDYFTAKNMMTARIEKTKNTYAIHHWASKYISDKCRKRRKRNWAVRRIFGENTWITKIIFRLAGSFDRIIRDGLFVSSKYYFDRFIMKKSPNSPHGTNENI